MSIEKIELTYKGLLVTIVGDELDGYQFYNEIEQILSKGYETRSEAIDEAIKKADEDLTYYKENFGTRFFN